MIKKNFLGLGPMSLEVINSFNSFSKKYKKKIMLICSRNQIDSEKFGGGYVNNFSTSDFSDFVAKKKNDLLIMSRDHCGPFKKDTKKKFSLKQEVDNCKVSLSDDISHNFRIIHIDTSGCGGAKYEVATELINFCNNEALKNKKKIFFEFGAEDHGVLTNFKKFTRDAKFFSKFSNKQFIVCQTGSLVKSLFQVGQFDISSVKIMKKIARDNGILLKEHNCDYLNLEQIQLRKKYGINAINIAPEFGSIQSNLTYIIAHELGFLSEINEFKKLVLKKEKWKKWIYFKENDMIKFLTAGHYHFGTKTYKNLLYKINRKLNFQKRLDKAIENNLLRFN